VASGWWLVEGCQVPVVRRQWIVASCQQSRTGLDHLGNRTTRIERPRMMPISGSPCNSLLPSRRRRRQIDTEPGSETVTLELPAQLLADYPGTFQEFVKDLRLAAAIE